MAFVSSRSRDRARRRNAVILGVGRIAVVFVAIGAVVYSSYQGGIALAEIKLVSLRRDLAQVSAERDREHAARDAAQTALTQANERIATLQASYAADVPQGPLASVLQQARARIADGLPADRIAEALRNVRAVTPCEGRPNTKRFVLRPGSQPVAEDTVSFADGLITLFVTPAAEDPARSLTAYVTRFGSPTITLSGASPLRMALAIDNAELRLSVAQSELRGFVTASVSNCGR